MTIDQTETGTGAASSKQPMNAAWSLLATARDPARQNDPAILFKDEAVTWSQLQDRAQRFAAIVRQSGLKRGDRVMVMVHDRPDFFYVYLGTLLAGGVAVALNVRSSAKDLLFAVNDSDCRLLVIDTEYLALYEEIAGQVTNPPRVISADAPVPGVSYLKSFIDGTQPSPEVADTRADDIAFWMYTSGTTGMPKAAMHRHRAYLTADRFLGDVLGVGPKDRLFCSSKLFFAFALGHIFFGGLARGATVILYDGWPSSDAVAEVVERYRPTVMFSVPTFYRNLLQDGAAERPEFQTVRRFVSAGERLPESLFEKWREATGVPILEGIGATETVFLFLSNRPDRQRAGMTGIPTPGTEVELRSEDGTVIDQPDQPGILWVRLNSLAAGYWNQADKTADAFVDGWYRTGDVFCRDGEGWYSHQGRGDDMLKISGQWVSPAEIEDHVLRVPGILDAAVVGAPNADGLVRLALFVIKDESYSEPALEANIRDFLTSALSVYKCPRRIRFVDDMPRTATGKVQRFRLREEAARLMQTA